MMPQIPFFKFVCRPAYKDMCISFSSHCESGGEAGSADTARDPRGFAVKMYTEEGNWDLVGNNTPIFFIRDPMMVSSL